jgi:hypothetical protein
MKTRSSAVFILITFLSTLFFVPTVNAGKPQFSYSCVYHYTTADIFYSGNSYLRINPTKTLGGTTQIYYHFYSGTELLGYTTGTKTNNFFGSYETYNLPFPNIDSVRYSIIGGGGKKALENGFIDLASCIEQ